MKQIKSVNTRGGQLFITLDVVLKFRGGPEVHVDVMATIVQNRRDRWVFEEIEIQCIDDFKLNGITVSDTERENYLRVMRAVNVDYDAKIERAVTRHCRRMGVERLAATAGINITN